MLNKQHKKKGKMSTKKMLSWQFVLEGATAPVAPPFVFAPAYF